VPAVAGVWLASILVPALLLFAVPERRDRIAITAIVLGTAGCAALAGPIVRAAEDGEGPSPTWWRANPFARGDPDAKHLLAFHTAIVAAVLVIVVWRTLVMIRRTTSVRRPWLWPVVVPGCGWIVLIVSTELARLADPSWSRNYLVDETPEATLFLQIAPLVAIAAFVAGAAWAELAAPALRRTDRGPVLGDATAVGVTRYLTRALADPSIRIAYWSIDDASWRDSDGRVIELPVDDPERAVTIFRRNGEPHVAFVHDAALASQPDVVAQVATAAALALETERLTALANARVDDARRLTARLVSSADAARRDVYAQLLEGPAEELERLARIVRDGLPTGGEELVRGLRAVVADVRELSHGLYPAALTEHGLPAVLSTSSPVPSRRYPPSVEVTAYLAARADPGAVITEVAGELVIELTSAPGDPRLVDRLAVLGGRIEDRVVRVPVGATWT
jgi:hypothetical protein